MNVAHQFGLMKRIANGGTPDYDSIRTVCESLSMTKAQRKLVIVITDGYGDTVAMAKLTRSAYDLYGVDIIGFGIACWEGQFRQVYAVGAAVQSLDTLHKTVLKSVAQQLDMRDTRRNAKHRGATPRKAFLCTKTYTNCSPTVSGREPLRCTASPAMTSSRGAHAVRRGASSISFLMKPKSNLKGKNHASNTRAHP
jgi:hypothetical protein